MITVDIIVMIIIAALIAEYIDSTLGMGYGTTLTPLLLCMGFSVMQVVPAILLSEFITGLFAGFTHHAFGNVSFIPLGTVSDFIYRMQNKGLFSACRSYITKPMKIVILFSLCGLLGTTSAVFCAVNIPETYIKLYIGIMIASIGIFLIMAPCRSTAFSWKKIAVLGIIASCNKGLSGGGYGPLITGGQIISGVDEKSAVAITSMSEGMICFSGIITYIAFKDSVDLCIAPWLIAGGMLSVPLSALSVQYMKTDTMRKNIAVATIILGCFTLYKLF